MEDTAIILNHYAYSLRVDAQMLEYTEKSLLQSLLDEFQKFYDRFDTINHYYIYIEQSTVVKKTHIQGIVWTKISSHLMNSLRLASGGNDPVDTYHYVAPRRLNLLLPIAPKTLVKGPQTFRKINLRKYPCGSMKN